jgi:hypothetical protein
MQTKFEIGKHYQNRKGEYIVKEIFKGGLMEVEYVDVENIFATTLLDRTLQSRIIEQIKLEASRK